jgi:hypothetical protein
LHALKTSRLKLHALRKPPLLALLAGLAALAGPAPLGAEVDDAQSYALEAAEPYVKDGYSMRYEFWHGALKPGEDKQVRHQLFAGNEYWFWVATDVPDAELRVNIYDAEGNLVEAESWQKENVAGARLKPEKTGSYIVRVEVLKSTENEPVSWALAYGYR